MKTKNLKRRDAEAQIGDGHEEAQKEGTKRLDLGDAGIDLAWLLFVAVVEDNDWKALDLLFAFRDSRPAYMAKLLAEAKLALFADAPLALPGRSGRRSTRSRRGGRSVVAIPARTLCVSDLARVMSLRESEVAV